jgi:anti-anti-sigma factor
MKIEQRTVDHVTVLAPNGRIDTTTSAMVDGAVRGAVDGGARSLVVDFADVDYISSAGLRVFLVLAKRLKALDGHLVLCGMGPPVRQVFQLAGFLPLFSIEPSRDAALRALDPRP